MKGSKLFITVAVLVAILGLSFADVVLADPTPTPTVTPIPHPVVRFQGIVNNRPTPPDKVGVWVIDARSVQVVESTLLIEAQGEAVIGAHVEVLAKRVVPTTADAPDLEAIYIRTLRPPRERRITITGFVSEMGTEGSMNYLVVNRIKIYYDDSTEKDGEPEVGAFVKVQAKSTETGWYAESIKVFTRPHRRTVEFEGVIESKNDSKWVIGGHEVTVIPCATRPPPAQCTLIIGQPDIGRWAKVRALEQANGELFALMINVRDEAPTREEWTGKIEWLPPRWGAPPNYQGRWVVGGKAVWVTQDTRIVGTPRVGLDAHVVAWDLPGRQLTAESIEILPSTTLTPSLESSL